MRTKTKKVTTIASVSNKWKNICWKRIHPSWMLKRFGCGSIWVGKRSWHVTTRISEHQTKDSQVSQRLVEYASSTTVIEWKGLDACRTVEKLMTIEAIYISKRKSGLYTRDENSGR